MPNPLLLDLPERIETSRLLLRPPRPGDGPALYEAVTETLVDLRQFLASLPWVAAEQTLEGAEAYCRNAAANFMSRKDLPFFLFERASGQLLGGSGLHRTVWETPKSEVGYWCRTSRVGNGFVAETVEALTQYAFQHIGAVRTEIVTDADNARSRRVAEGCGYRLEGTLRNERRAPDGTLRTTCLYARFPDA